MPAVKFYTSWFCPFAQRAWIALHEKKIEFDYIEQDPYEKTAEWLAVSPRGLVPCIFHNGGSVYESQVCLEYIEEAFPGGVPFLPKEPLDRAYVRVWCDFISKKLVPPFYAMLMKHEKAERDEAKSEFTRAIVSIMSAMRGPGPYFLGDEFSMADIMLIPHCLRTKQILEHYRGFSIPDTPEFARYHTWYKAVTERDSLKKTIQDTDRIRAKYLRYADDTAVTEVATAIREGKTLP